MKANLQSYYLLPWSIQIEANCMSPAASFRAELHVFPLSTVSVISYDNPIHVKNTYILKYVGTGD